MNASDNPYLNILSSIDIVFIFEVVLSLMALLFAYDALAGEREQGTLRLVLTHSCPSRTHLTREIYQRDALPVRATVDESDPRDAFVDDNGIYLSKCR